MLLSLKTGGAEMRTIFLPLSLNAGRQKRDALISIVVVKVEGGRPWEFTSGMDEVQRKRR